MLLSLGILAYGLVRLPLLLLVILFVLHFLVGWTYSVAAIFRLDTHAAIAAAAANPFFPATAPAAAAPAPPVPAMPAAPTSVAKPVEPAPVAPSEPATEPEANRAPRRAAANPFAAPEE